MKSNHIIVTLIGMALLIAALFACQSDREAAQTQTLQPTVATSPIETIHWKLYSYDMESQIIILDGHEIIATVIDDRLYSFTMMHRPDCKTCKNQNTKP